MNDLERAVIEAARAWRSARETMSMPRSTELIDALIALDAYEKFSEGAGVSEVSWATVAEGDGLRAKSGAFYPVVSTKREWKMGAATGKFLITVQLPTGPKTLTRPVEGEPMATVRRSDTGKAVDQFVHVFMSGEL